MQNSRKNPLNSDRFIFQQMGGLSKEPGEAKDTLGEFTKKITESVTGQIEMLQDIEANQLKPIKAEQKKEMAIIREMKAESEKTGKSPEPRTFESFGKTITVEMDADGTYRETLDGEEINFLTWALKQQNESSEKSQSKF